MTTPDASCPPARVAWPGAESGVLRGLSDADVSVR
jgi:hypothetical protein